MDSDDDDEWGDRTGHHHVPMPSDDPIPANGIWLDAAFDLLFKSKVPNWRELYEEIDWERLGENNRDLDKWSAARAEAEHIFRTALMNGDLISYVRDGRTGETLQLAPTGWETPDWYIPRGIHSSHVDDFMTPGPTGTVIDGARRPVFLIRTKFEEWFRHQGFMGSPNASPSSEGLITNKRTPRHRRDATKEAIMALWGPDGLRAGLMAPQRDKTINDWLNEKGLQPVGARTIRRAFAELGRGRT